MDSNKSVIIFLLGFIAALYHHISEVNSADCSSYSTDVTCEAVSGCWWQSNECQCSSNVTMDICFALDASGSVGSDYFDIELAWLSSFVESSLSNSARVGIIRFATTSSMLKNFTDDQSDLSTFINSVSYTGGQTNTVAAIKQAIVMFEKESDDQRSKVFVILTDGNPFLKSGGDVDVCAWASTVKGDSISTYIIGVGDSWNPDNVDCLVDDTTNDILYVTSFNQSEFDKILPTLTEITCPIDYEVIITEVKIEDDSSTADYKAPFIEIYNPSSDITLSELTFSGVVSGTAVPAPDTTTVLAQGQYLVLYDSTATGVNVSCEECGCTLSGNGKYCQDALYIACDGTPCNFASGYTNTNWNLDVTDATDVIDSVEYDPTTWPGVATGYSFELKSKGYDNSEGANWQQSCNTFGTPGSDPITDCTEQCTASQCIASGGSSGSITASGDECICDISGYYVSGCSCSNVPMPGDCVAYWLKNITDNTRTVKYVWTRASTDEDHTYKLSYWVTSGSVDTVQTSSRTKTVVDYQYSRGSDKIAGYVKTVIEYSSGSTEESAEVNCTVVTQAPTPSPTPAPTNNPIPAPTESPTPAPTWSDPSLFLGGDLCEYERCSCNGFSDSCTGPDLYREYAENNDQEVFITVVQQPSDFPFTTLVYWTISFVGATTSDEADGLVNGVDSGTSRRRANAMRRILSKKGYNLNLDDITYLAGTGGSSSLFSSTMLPSTTYSQEPDFTPSSGYVNVSIKYSDIEGTQISGNNGKIGFVVVDESNPASDNDYELFYLQLHNCSVQDITDTYNECQLLYPSDLYLIIENGNGDSSFSSTTEEEMPAWLWWVIAALIIFLAILAWLVYRYWWQNKQTNKALNEKETELDNAIEELDEGFGRDLDQGDVGFNPLATGVPNSSRPADAMGAELANRQNFMGNDKADVAVERFQHRSAMGQVAPNRHQTG